VTLFNNKKTPSSGDQLFALAHFFIGEDIRMAERYFNRMHFTFLFSVSMAISNQSIDRLGMESLLTGRTSVQVKDFRRLRIATSERMVSSRVFSRFFRATCNGDVASTGNVRIRLDVLSLKNFFVFFFFSFIQSSIVQFFL
jgi:hypothetical protein